MLWLFSLIYLPLLFKPDIEQTLPFVFASEKQWGSLEQLGFLAAVIYNTLLWRKNKLEAIVLVTVDGPLASFLTLIINQPVEAEDLLHHKLTHNS